MESLGLKNVSFAQADILELDGIGRQFDVVECGAVLHQLADPVAGWRVLAGRTKPGGYMLMGLYSDLGRRDLDAAIAFARSGNYGTSADELRRFRADVLALPARDPARSIAVERNDFYNLSLLRELVFAPAEHRFTIGAIRAALQQLGLEFGGFGLQPEILSAFQQAFGPQANTRSLEQWEIFEHDHPAMFSGAYHFVAQRPAR
jgi:SAM-dependent methyltransferase